MAKPPKTLTPDQSLSAYFGFELRKHREAAGLSQPELADRLHWSKSTVGNLETAFRSPTAAHATDLDRFFQTDRFGWLHGLIKQEEIPDFFRPFALKEPEATDIRMFEPVLVPGLLQTEAYARTIVAAERRPEHLEQTVAVRMERQRILCRNDPAPPRMWAILDEAVIRREVGGTKVMKEQLESLVAATERYNVIIQIVPRSVAAYPGVEGGFSILRFDEGADIAYAEAAGGGHVIEQQKDVARAVTRFDLIRTHAMSVEDTIRMITEAM